MMNRNLNLLLSCCLGWLVGCGGATLPDARDQIGSELAVPTGPQETGMFLTEKGAPVVYNGSILFWHEDVTADQIRRISKSSLESRQLKAEILNFIRSTLTPSRELVEQSKRDLADATAAKVADQARKKRSNTVVINLQRVLVAQWFEGRLKELVERGDVADGELAREHFHAYCEAKVWQLATSRLATVDYQWRPTPNQMCESYYATAGLFGGEFCQDPQAGSKSFFQCLWREGVLKTKIGSRAWADLPCDDNPTDHYQSREQAILAWLDEAGDKSLLEQIISDTGIASTFTEQTYSERLAEIVMLGSKFRTKIARREVGGSRIYADVTRCESAFQRKELRDSGAGPVPWSMQDPGILLTIGEGDGSTATDYALIPSTADSDLNSRNWSLLAKFVRLFGMRQVHTGRNEENPVSVSDHIFLRPKNGDWWVPQDEKCLILGPANAQDRCEADPAFASIRDYLDGLIDPALANIETQKQAGLTHAEAKAKNAEAQARSFLRENLPAQIAEGIAASSDPGAAITLLGYGLKIIPAGEKVMLSVQFVDGEAPLTGCFFAATGESCAIEEPIERGLLDARFDRERTEISFSVDLSRPAQGFRHLSRGVVDPYFNEITDDELGQSLLRFKLYPNQLGEALYFLTGDVWLEREGETIYSGSTSADAFGDQVPKI